MRQGNLIKFTDNKGRKWVIRIKDSAIKVLKTLKLEEFEKDMAKILGALGTDICDDVIATPTYSYLYYGFYINRIFYTNADKVFYCDLHNKNHLSESTESDYRYYRLLGNFNVDIDKFKKGLYKGDYESLVRDVMRYKGRVESDGNIPIFCINYNASILTVNRIDCFGNSTHSNLTNLFNHMIKVFGWTDDVQNIIYNHSIFGRAYVNTMEAFALRFHNQPTIYPTSLTETNILSHFKKLLIREQYRGKHIDVHIRKKYMMN